MPVPPSPSTSSATLLTEQAAEWFVKLHSEQFNEHEMYAFADWLATDHEHSEAFAGVEKLFSEMVLAEKSLLDSKLQGQAKLALTNQTSKKQWISGYKRCLVPVLAMAAVWLFAVAMVIPQNSRVFSDYLADASSKVGEIRDLSLADGSHVLLNTNTAISIKFDGHKRQVDLHHGQALFTVAADANRPFEVVTDNLVTRALGTVFEVYERGQNGATVTVAEHAVAVQINAGGPSGPTVPVISGQQVKYRAGDPGLVPKSIDMEPAKAWQQQRLFINDQPLSELVAELSRYRNGRVFLADENLKNLRVTGVFSLNNPEGVLSKVCQVLNLKQSRIGPWWVLLHR